ncbi:guanine deaminase [Oleiphilus sp. HI0071]|jgi:guanine deaminase|nr:MULTISPECIES: guanine deaminase [unclassified Oleiphilus]KZY64903.1 guanine deaminase [Oleiphilus sp. HI0065]KZY82882.1 guanine deaminase [Oleiphilus sp. HI0071]KZZ04807.1 guanine deaminase [Oleiphilus sp. HI0073]KZZ44879.1 guanine deaminase [Oleiphilus sp. HI0118]KZZ49188.1 guanine deaminase [Oleiphilus sp. HI0122]
MSIKLFRASVLHFLSDPDIDGENAYEFFEDGALVVNDGHVVELGEASELLAKHTTAEIVDYTGKLIIPGMIDTHIHFPQVEVIASYGEQLLDWLNNYTFPAERQFEDKEYASNIANFFLDELLKCGTTTALVFGTVHKQSVEAFFEASEQRNTRMICGKVMMDRNAPEYLTDTPESAYQDSKALIEAWHEKGRQLYAVTPRFAITSTEAQLEKAGQLIAEHPSVFMQTHISENHDEVAFVDELFPDAIDYLDVYDRYGLLGPRAVFAHGIHLYPREHQRLRETGSSVSFCPTSNLFLGSGLLDIRQLEREQVNYSVATDVGGGTSFSMLTTLAEAYKINQLQNHSLSPLKSMYMATLGNAKSLQLDDKIGSFQAGREADFAVLDYDATPLMSLKQSKCKTLDEKLFAMIILGDDRAVKATYVAGECAHEKH